MNVIFAAPLLSENASLSIAATASLEGVRVGVISMQPLETLAEPLRDKVAAHWRVDDILSVDALSWAVENVAARLGGVDRLFAAYEQLQVPIAVVRERFSIDGMRPDAARNFRDKGRMKDLLQDAGIPCARHRQVSNASEARAFVAEIGYPVVYKPLEGAGARATFRIDTREQLEHVLQLSPPESAQTLIEEYMTGEEHSLETISIRGQAVWHSLTHYSPTPLEVLRNDWIQWCIVLPREVDEPQYDDIRDAAGRALQVLGMDTGLTHMEWFRRPDGSVAISEVAARPPGAQIMKLVSLAHEIDFESAWARLMVFGTFDAPPRRWSTGAAFLRGQGAGSVVALHRVEEAIREAGPLIAEVRLPAIGQPSMGTYEGEGWIIVRAGETAEVQRALKRIISLVRVDLG
jgi:formate-dependent phosphoribosylglycinamide formyltransferase (GAR transformylase)